MAPSFLGLEEGREIDMPHSTFIQGLFHCIQDDLVIPYEYKTNAVYRDE